MNPLHLAAALKGAGWHPGVGPGTAAPGHWTDLARTAEGGLLDLVTIEDPVGPRPGAPGAPEARDARPDALSIATLAARSTSRIGLVPALTATYDEPSRTAAALATLDRDSRGRAGWRVRTALTPGEADPAGLRRGRLCAPAAKALIADVLEQAADSVDQVRGLRDPQQSPLVVSLGYGYPTFRLAARAADVVLTTPHDAFGAAMLAELVRGAERDVDRHGPPLRILADLVVLLDDTVEAARERLDRLDAVERLEGDAAVVATTASGLADLMLAWAPAGIDGYRLRPARLPADLERITGELVPELQRRGAFRTAYDEPTLRARFGLDHHAGAVAS